VFDIFGDLAHFRKFYTTSSPLTYDFPPKTALTGILGAIIGLDYEERYELNEAKIGLKIKKIPRKLYFGLNWLNTKWDSKINSENSRKWFETILGIQISDKNLKEICAFTSLEWGEHSPHTQSMIEFLYEPEYRIYYNYSNPNAERIEKMLIEHKSFYPVYFGLSEFSCNYRFLGCFPFETKKMSQKAIEIHSIIPEFALITDVPNAIEISNEDKIIIENLPYLMVSGRKVTDYKRFLYSVTGNPIKARVKEYCQISYPNQVENIIYL